jgi:hypothetical protein
MKRVSLKFLCIIAAVVIISCSGRQKTAEENTIHPPATSLKSAPKGSLFGPAGEFLGSPYGVIGISGFFNVHGANECCIAVLKNGDESFSARIQSLKEAKTSVRIQSLRFLATATTALLPPLLILDPLIFSFHFPVFSN